MDELESKDNSVEEDLNFLESDLAENPNPEFAAIQRESIEELRSYVEEHIGEEQHPIRKGAKMTAIALASEAMAVAGTIYGYSPLGRTSVFWFTVMAIAVFTGGMCFTHSWIAYKYDKATANKVMSVMVTVICLAFIVGLIWVTKTVANS